MSTRAVVVAVLLAVGATRPLAGQGINHLYDKFQISASAAAVYIGSTIRLDPDDGREGTEINTNDLGLNRAGVRPRLGFRWRPGRRHELEASVLFISRSGSREIDKDITIDSVTYTAGARLDSRLGSNQIGVNYRWAFHASEKSQFGLNVGLGVTVFKPKFTGQASISTENGVIADTATYSRTLLGPSLALGAFGRWALSERWYIEADAGALYVPVDNIKVGILTANGAARYFPLTRFGLELGYGLIWQQITVDQKDNPTIDLGASGKIKYTTQNLRLGVIGTF
jgi:hypothetical protein